MNLREEFEPVLRDLFVEIEKLYEELSEQGFDRDNLEDDDIVTEIDIEITSLVKDFFEKMDGNYRIESEELNKKERVSRTDNPDYTVILDEIDGTGNMCDQSAPFGTIIGIAEGQNPEFQDIVAAGFFDLMRNLSYTAFRNEGSFRTDVETGETERIETGEDKLDNQGDLLLDQAMIGKKYEIAENLWKHWCKDLGSQGLHFSLVSEGAYDAFITGGHGYVKEVNTAEEVGPLYLLVTEAGGIVTNWNGEEIRSTKIGLESKKNHDIIAAQNEMIAEEISEEILCK